jgi:mgtE-like transporter
VNPSWLLSESEWVIYIGTTKETSGPSGLFQQSIPFQTLIALSLNSLSILAGRLIFVFSPIFDSSPWILALFPPVLTIRGGIGGIFAGNLTTMLHLGLIQPRIRDNTPDYYNLLKSIMVMTTIDTLFLGLISFFMNLVGGTANLSKLPIFMIAPCVTCVLAVTISVPLTSIIGIETFKRGLDPDILVYPILASLNDILVTSCFVLTINLILTGMLGWLILVTLFSFILIITGYTFWRNHQKRFFRQTLTEGTTGVVLASMMGSINGVFLSRIQVVLTGNPGLVVLYPSLTNALGSIGSIIGSTSTTNMALGFAGSLSEEVKKAAKLIIQIEIPAASMYVTFGILSYIIVGGRKSGARLGFLVGSALISNLSSFILISLFALSIANLAFKRGLNPDNVVIPTITSISDSMATLTLLPAVIIANMIGL